MIKRVLARGQKRALRSYRAKRLGLKEVPPNYGFNERETKTFNCLPYALGSENKSVEFNQSKINVGRQDDRKARL